MKKKYQNAFFLFGLLVLAVMLTQLDFKQVLDILIIMMLKLLFHLQ